MQNQYNRDELLACSHGQLFGEGNAKLPAPNMLMMDRITTITADGGQFGKGHMMAELDIYPSLWFFDCHFPGDPVMPGCLGLDAMWQLVGFFLGWSGHPGKGRALGVGEVKLTGQIHQLLNLDFPWTLSMQMTSTSMMKRKKKQRWRRGSRIAALAHACGEPPAELVDRTVLRFVVRAFHRCNGTERPA